jgi:probable HAF family extracellular repeat protein
MAHGINNLGQVVGGSDLPSDQTTHAFLETQKPRKMKDLGVVGDDYWSFGLGINALLRINTVNGCTSRARRRCLRVANGEGKVRSTRSLRR